jgi:hypothetical protein
MFYGAVCQTLLPFHTSHRHFQRRYENLALSYGQGGEHITSGSLTMGIH